jgi:hypothetical protein
MADPVIPGGIRVQWVMPGKSGLPEDRYVTTWAFRTADGLPPNAGLLDSAADAVEGFYTGVTAPQTAAITTFLSRYIDGSKVEARVYRLGDLPPREVTVVPKPLTLSSSSQGPSEVSLCASFYSQRNLPRRRGRVYVGPLAMTSTVVDQGDGTQPTRPALSLRNALLGSMQRLRTNSEFLGIPWSVLSQVDAEMKVVTAGWVDNAFDTQRRRGEEPTSRLTWTGVV